MPAHCCLVVISLCPNPSTFLYLSLHICAARLLPLRLWPAWRPRFTNRLVKNTFVSFTYQGPSCRACTQCSSRTATISFYFDLRTATSFPTSFHWLSSSPKISPNAIITVLSSTHCALVGCPFARPLRLLFIIFITYNHLMH